MEIIIFKRGKNQTTCVEYLRAELVARQKNTIVVRTQTWFPQELGVAFFVKKESRSDELVLVEFDQNNEVKSPYTYLGKIDTSIRCARDKT